MKQVVISVIGGVAEIAYASDGVDIAIVDFDNAEAEGKSGEHKLRYWIAKAKRDEKPNGSATRPATLDPVAVALLSDAELRDAVHAALGWERFPEHDTSDGQYYARFDAGHFVEDAICSDLPDYPNDLNACHNMEKAGITDMFMRRRYYQTLDRITGDQWNTIVATARQRCEAFILTKTDEGG